MKVRILVILTLILSAFAVFAAYAQDDEPTDEPVGNFVLPESVFLRAGPGEDYLPVGSLFQGNTVTPVSRNVTGDWILIQHRRGFGWISRNLVVWNLSDLDVLPVIETTNLTPTIPPGRETATPFFPTNTPSANYVFIEAQSAYVRAGPGRGYLRLGQLLQGDTVDPVGRNEDTTWIMIRFERGFAWIAQNLVRWQDEVALENLPVLSVDDLTPSPTFTPSATLEPSDTPTETLTPTPTLSPTPTETLTRTLTPTLTSTVTLTPSQTPTPEPTDTVEPSDTPTDAPTATVAPSETPTNEPTATLEPSATSTATDEPTATSTPTDEPSSTVQPSETPTEEPDDTPTDAPTATVEPLATLTPSQTPTPEPTDTVEPSDTPTDKPAATSTPTPTPSEIPTNTVEPGETPTDEPAATIEPSETATEVSVRVVVPTSTATVESSAMPSPEPTDTPTAEPTATIVPSATGEPSDTPTAEPTVTVEPSETATEASTATPSPELTDEAAVVVESSPSTPVQSSATPADAPTLTPPAEPTDEPITPQDTGTSGAEPGDSGPPIRPEAIIGIILLVVVLGYVALYLQGVAAVNRYSRGFVVERCPVCMRGQLTVETRQERVFGIPRAKRVVRCNECRSVLREVGTRKWRYAVDPIENPNVYARYNGSELTDSRLKQLDSEPLPPPKFVEPRTLPKFVEDDDNE